MTSSSYYINLYSAPLHDKFYSTLSDGVVYVHDYGGNLEVKGKWCMPSGCPPTDIKCIDNFTLLATSTDTFLRGTDIRQKDFAFELRDNERFPLTAVAVPIQGYENVVAVGTELVKDESKIKLWDLRNFREPLKQITDSLSDDVTQLHFHPKFNNILASGSTDGLVCLFDLRVNVEEDVMIQAINSESSVSKFGFFGRNYEYLYLMTHIETFSMWNLNQASKIVDFGDVRCFPSCLNRVDYLVDCVYDINSENIFLYTGDPNGNLDEWLIGLKGLTLNKEMRGGHRDIVRAILRNPLDGTVISCSEDGSIKHWKH